MSIATIETTEHDGWDPYHTVRIEGLPGGLSIWSRDGGVRVIWCSDEDENQVTRCINVGFLSREDIEENSKEIQNGN